MWFRTSRLRRYSLSTANVDCQEESVSHAQLASTCVAALVGKTGTHIILADGHRVTVPQKIVERSGVLTELVNAAELASPVLVGGRAHLHAWFKYLQSTEGERQSLSWIALLRNLMVCSCICEVGVALLSS